MKYMLWISFIMIGCLQIVSCDKVQVGYNHSEFSYNPDSLVIKATLDKGEDAERIKFQIPWKSNGIEGLDGTFPFTYRIKCIDSDNGFEGADTEITVKANGGYEIPCAHQLPRGVYTISLFVTNVHETVELDSIFRVIVR